LLRLKEPTESARVESKTWLDWEERSEFVQCFTFLEILNDDSSNPVSCIECRLKPETERDCFSMRKFQIPESFALIHFCSSVWMWQHTVRTHLLLFLGGKQRRCRKTTAGVRWLIELRSVRRDPKTDIFFFPFFSLLPVSNNGSSRSISASRKHLSG